MKRLISKAIVVEATLRTWRSSKVDRGDTYLKRHWFELRINGDATAVLYFDRGAKRGSARWWLFSLDDAEGAPE